jgi:hypothetical protein
MASVIVDSVTLHPKKEKKILTLPVGGSANNSFSVVTCHILTRNLCVKKLIEIYAYILLQYRMSLCCIWILDGRRPSVVKYPVVDIFTSA